MRLRNFMIILVILMITACTSQNFIKNPKITREQAERMSKFTGWVYFGGIDKGYIEFNLWKDKEKIGQLYTGNCINGALPLKEQRKAAQVFHGKQVIVYGKTVSASVINGEVIFITYGGTRMENSCGNKKLLYADLIMLKRSIVSESDESSQK